MRHAIAVAVGGLLVMTGCGASDVDGGSTNSGVASTSVRAADSGPPGRNPGVDKYPLGKGRYLFTADPGWVYFKTAAGQSCGIGPIGNVVGCDDVPADAPAGTNQTLIDGQAPAGYVRSDTPTFTRDVDVLPVGYRLTNGGTRCAVEPQGIVHCETIGGKHGFIVADGHGTLW